MIKPVPGSPRGRRAGVTGPWITELRASPGRPRGRVLAFPHAAAGPNTLLPMLDRLPETYAVFGVTLPGRERRLHERPPAAPVDAGAVLAGILDDFVRLPPGPTVLFGHSLGGVLAAELALAAPERCAGVVVSACHARGPAARGAGDAALSDMVRRGGGAAAELLREPYWREHILALLRFDVALGRRLAHDIDRGRLRVPLTVLGGDRDELLPVPELASWQDRAGAGMRTRVLSGGHFYLLDETNRDAVAAEIARSIEAAHPGRERGGGSPVANRLPPD
ncbi:alpha/beta fold hydrolase [Actinoallomurus acanthiterrae]